MCLGFGIFEQSLVFWNLVPLWVLNCSFKTFCFLNPHFCFLCFVCLVFGPMWIASLDFYRIFSIWASSNNTCTIIYCELVLLWMVLLLEWLVLESSSLCPELLVLWACICMECIFGSLWAILLMFFCFFYLIASQNTL